MFFEARDIMLRAKMSLTKWSSSDKGVTGKVFQTPGTAQPEVDLAPTKRIVLIYMSSLFNPINWLAHLVMGAKSMFQQTWELWIPWVFL